MLAFPQRLLEGEQPHVDFLHLYGPASLYVLAGAFRIFGDTLTTERAIGLLQLLAAAVAVGWLSRPWGRWISGLLTLVTLTMCFWPLGLTAMAWNGAIAWWLFAIVFVVRLFTGTGSGNFNAYGLGACAALAVAYRPDLAGSVLLASITLTVIFRTGAAVRIPIRNVLLGALPILIGVFGFVSWVGIPAAWHGMFVEPVFELRAGRSLPVPPSWGVKDGFLQRAEDLGNIQWPLPGIPQSQQIALWFWAVVAMAIAPLAVMLWRWKRGSRTNLDAALLVAAAAALGLLPQALQRPDTTHLAWVSYPVLPIALLVVVHVLRQRRSGERRVWGSVIIVIAALYGFVAPFYALRGTTDLILRGIGAKPVIGFEIRNGEQRYYLANDVMARDAQQIINALAPISSPGDRLFVGPRDLRYTNCSDAYMYGMFPELKPATRFIEMDPGVTNHPNSGLTEEIRGADWVVLSETAATWREPNDSRVPGDPRPNRVVKASFCVVLNTEHFDLLRACE